MRFLTIVCFFFIAHSAYAQSITGRVVDEQTNKPLEKASVIIQGNNKGTVTDANGLFTIDNLPSGTYQLSFSIIGYATVTRTVELKDGPVYLDIVVKPQTGQLSGVTVIGATAEQAEAKKSTQ